MANILLCYYSEYAENYYDAISDFLKQNNNILRINIKSKQFQITEWAGKSYVKSKTIYKIIDSFKPDIIFSFNNSCPYSIYKHVDCMCKRLVIDVDNPEFFFNKSDLIKNCNKFYFLGYQSKSIRFYERFLNKNIDDRYLYFPPATSATKQTHKFQHNVSFIGSNFLGNPERFIVDKKDLEEINKIYNILVKDYYSKKLYLFNKQNIDIAKSLYSGQHRLKYLSSIEDLGLTIYGDNTWDFLGKINLDLAQCVSNKKVTSLKENIFVYNSSKISVNISHPQAKTGFSWRVMDIMASNSCLLTEYKKDWMDLFGKYISKNTLNAIIYKNKDDFRSKVIKLLNDEKLRLACVKELNFAIEQNGRWTKRFNDLEKFLGISFGEKVNETQQYIFIKPAKKIKPQKLVERSNLKPVHDSNYTISRDIKTRLLLVACSCLLILGQIPIISRFIIKRNARIKIQAKIANCKR